MRTLIFALVLFALNAFAAPQPNVWVNPWSTNRSPMPVMATNSLSVSNVIPGGNGSNWLFYGIGPKTVATLGEITNVGNGIFVKKFNGFSDNQTATNLSVESFLHITQSGVSRGLIAPDDAAEEIQFWNQYAGASIGLSSGLNIGTRPTLYPRNVNWDLGTSGNRWNTLWATNLDISLGATIASGGANPFIFDPTLGVLSIGSAEITLGVNGIGFDTSGGGFISITNTDFGPAPIWKVDGSGNLTNGGNMNVAGSQTNWGQFRLRTATASKLAAWDGTDNLTNSIYSDSDIKGAIPALTNVWLYASSGIGTTNSPFRGVEGNINFKPFTGYDWGGYVYAITNTLHLGHEGSHHYGRGASIYFHGIGFSNAVEFISTNSVTFAVGFQDFNIFGGTNSTQAVMNALYIDSMHHGSYFKNLRLRDCRSAGLLVNFSVGGLYDNIYVARGGENAGESGILEPAIVRPTNGIVIGNTAGGTSQGSWASIFNDVSVADVPGMGIVVHTANNTVMKGISELNGGGLYVNNTSGIDTDGNYFNMAIENNATNDLLILSSFNVFLGYATGLTTVVSGTGNRFENGFYGIIDHQNGPNRTTFENIEFNFRTNSSLIGGRCNWINCYDRVNGVYVTNEFNNSTEFKSGNTADNTPALILRSQFGSTGDLLQWQSFARANYGVISSNGNVGIKTNAPATTLDVVGTMHIRDGMTNDTHIKSLGGISAVASIQSQSLLAFGNNTTVKSYINANNDGQMTLNNNAGGAATYICFNGITAAFPAIARTNGSLLLTDGTGSLSGGTNNLLLPGTGSVGFGTLTPAAKLDVVGGINSTSCVPTNGIFFPATNIISAPANFTYMGANLFSDGTNLIAVFQNAAGTRTTNKLTMAAWP